VRSILARHPKIDAKTKVSIYFSDFLVLHPTADQAVGRSVEVLRVVEIGRLIQLVLTLILIMVVVTASMQWWW
jgi:hypothetical protein